MVAPGSGSFSRRWLMISAPVTRPATVTSGPKTLGTGLTSITILGKYFRTSPANSSQSLAAAKPVKTTRLPVGERSEEHTSELQSRPHLVCRLLLEKKKK